MAGKKITGRTKQLSLKATPEFHQELKETAVKEKCLMIEILEKAFADYKRKLVINKAMKENDKSIVSPATPSKKHPRDEEEINTDFKKIKISD